MTVIGWGKTAADSTISNVLKEAVVSTVSDGSCNSVYTESLTTDIICAEKITGSTCSGTACVLKKLT